MNRRGVTLAEVLVVSTIGVVVILAFGQTDMTRVYIEQQALKPALAESEAITAMAHVLKRLEQADRVNVISSGCLTCPPANFQIRLPQPNADLDAPIGYRWVQYKQGGRSLLFYAGTCSSPATFFEGITGLTLTYQDNSPAPPGGEPFPPSPVDNNLVEVLITTETAAETLTLQSGTAIKAEPYSNVNANCSALTGPCDSGSGLAPLGVANPPAACP